MRNLQSNLPLRFGVKSALSDMCQEGGEDDNDARVLRRDRQKAGTKDGRNKGKQRIDAELQTLSFCLEVCSSHMRPKKIQGGPRDWTPDIERN